MESYDAYYYDIGGIETIDFIQAKLSDGAFMGFLHGNVMKYVARMGHKGNTREDARKAIWYLERMIEEMKDE